MAISDQERHNIKMETVDSVIQYLNNRFSDDLHSTTRWVFPDGRTFTTDIGYAEEWWYNCGVEELKHLKETL